MKRIYSVFVIALLLILSGCHLSKHEPGAEIEASDGGLIKVQGTRFIDTFGRQVIFSGFNYVDKNPAENYILRDSVELYNQFHKWGINCLRLGLIWDGVEPEPGKYDEKYLDAMEQKVKWAGNHHIYIMLDMHQDLYSRRFSDGAPLWATLDEKLPHQTGAIWSDSYLMSGAVQRSFDNFWENKPVADGIGVQDHYVNMWKHLAQRFSKYDNIIGYDVMNEPFNGSNANMVMPLILTEYAKLLVEETGQAPPGEQELLMMWADEKSRLKVLKKLANAAKYSRIIDAALEPVRQFETTKLQSFYQRATDAIRLADTTHIIFLEHGYFSNTGIKTSIEPVNGKTGQRDPQQAYAAHAYDLIVDTKDADNQSNERVDLIFSRIQETSKRTNMPVLVGEWGAFYGLDAASIQPARFILSLFERYNFGNTYWAFNGEMGIKPGFKEALLRPFPQYTAGSLNSYSLNHEAGVFACCWQEDSKIVQPTVIYIPDLKYLIKESIKLMPEVKSTVIQSIENSDSGYLIIPVSGKSIQRNLEFKLRTDHTSISIDRKN